ncbi:hypothetical protein H4S02_009957, partial [Coemansia sp. RSA 2611]
MDDVLFRGNNATLEYLDFHLDIDTVLMLSQRRVFENRHKALQHVIVRGCLSDWFSHEEDPDDNTKVDDDDTKVD